MIESIGYDASSRTLEIVFKSSRSVWHYMDFPKKLWNRFVKAESKGKFFHQNIKGEYDECRVR